jgi:hypothetical protein
MAITLSSSANTIRCGSVHDWGYFGPHAASSTAIAASHKQHLAACATSRLRLPSPITIIVDAPAMAYGYCIIRFKLTRLNNIMGPA